MGLLHRRRVQRASSADNQLTQSLLGNHRRCLAFCASRASKSGTRGDSAQTKITGSIPDPFVVFFFSATSPTIRRRFVLLASSGSAPRASLDLLLLLWRTSSQVKLPPFSMPTRVKLSSVCVPCHPLVDCRVSSWRPAVLLISETLSAQGRSSTRVQLAP